MFAVSAVVLLFLGMWKALELGVRVAERIYTWRIERRRRRLAVVVPWAVVVVVRGRR